MRERAEEALARRGRASAGFPLCVYTTVRMDDDVATAERVTTEFLATYYGGGVHSRGTMGLGPADAVVTALRRYAAAGVTDLCLRFVGDDQLAQMERFTAEVLPALRWRGTLRNPRVRRISSTPLYFSFLFGRRAAQRQEIAHSRANRAHWFSGWKCTGCSEMLL